MGEPPNFYFKVGSSNRTAFNQQIREAVRIRRGGGEGSILNSTAEFNRCHIYCLVKEEEDDNSREDEELSRMLEDMDINREGQKSNE